MVRGTWSQVFRAPTINDQFGSQQGTFPTFSDPCQNAKGTEPGYSRACEFIAPGSGYKQDNSQILAFLGGNRGLKPESGKVFTLGFVYDSSLIKGLSTGADAWHYRLNQAITSPDPNVLASGCLNSPNDEFCNRIHREAGTGQIANINLSSLNAGFIETSGVDFSLNYLLPPTEYGRFAAGLEAAYTSSFKYDLGDGVEKQAAGRLDPNYGNHARLRTTSNLKWAMGPFGVQWSSRFIAATNVTQSAEANFWSADPGAVTFVRQGGVTYHDLALSYNLDQTKTKFIVGVNNVGDKQPPFAYQSVINGNVDVNTYDTIGRRWFARVEQSF
jgi:outer membrane receptor protein involved in Fe transport